MKFIRHFTVKKRDSAASGEVLAYIFSGLFINMQCIIAGLFVVKIFLGTEISCVALENQAFVNRF